MTSFKATIRAISAMVAVVALAACGGGGGGGDDGSPGPSGPNVSQGVVTAKGSIFVNGVRFTTTGATIKVDDNPGVEDDIKVGMIVKVRGVSDDATKLGTATAVEAWDALEGQIEAIDGIGKTLTVMGQTVRIEDNVTRLNDDDTIKVFAGAGFAVGQTVEVNGFPDDNGGLRATRVATKVSGEFEIKGFVTGLGASSFGLALIPGGAASLTVNFTTLPAGVVNGSFVEVKSLLAPVGGAITASFIELEDALGAAGEKVEVEGIITSGTFGAVDNFFVNGQRVITSSATLFEGGLKSDLALGVKVEAEGPLDASGAILAVKVSFRSSIRIEAPASAVTANGLTVLGKSVTINQFTRVDNGPVADGDNVQVRAFLDRDGNLIATRIVKLSASSRVILQGPVTAFNAAAGTMTILDINLATNAQTEFRLSNDSSETPISAATFFANLTANVTIVKVRWDPFTATSAPIKQAEIELGE